MMGVHMSAATLAKSSASDVFAALEIQTAQRKIIVAKPMKTLINLFFYESHLSPHCNNVCVVILALMQLVADWL